MLDRDVRLARPLPKEAADIPTARIVRVERERAVNQRHHRVNILAEVGKRVGGSDQNEGVVASYFQCPPCIIDTLQAVQLRIFAATVTKQPLAAQGGASERRPIMRGARGRPLPQAA